MRKLLTQRVVDTLKPVAGKDVWIFDTTVPGFHVRRDANGWKSYALQFTSPVTGTRRRIAFAPTATLTAAEARKRAQELSRDIALGKDPLAENQGRR